MVSEVRGEDFKSGFLNPTGYFGERNYQAEFYNNRVIINTGLIGQPKAVRVYNRQGHQELSTSFGYANNIVNADGIAGQGHFTEGTMTNEVLDLTYHRTNRTTKEYVPSILTSSSSTRNGVSIGTTNELYDFYTGQVLSTAFTNSQGRRYHSVTVPAYTLPGYASMGAKSDGPGNRHMLTQPAAAYTVLELPGNPGYNVLNPLNPLTSSVLSASVKTWKNNWNNYRVASTTGQYQDDAATQQPVWREHATYAWQSSLLKPDGSFGSFADYNWNGPSDTHWVKARESLRYDHYSHELESRDVNGQYAATKTGHNGTQVLASAANAQYTELAYSGAEDVPVDQNGLKHFGGEMVSNGTKADGTQGTPIPHTGNYSIRLAAEQAMRYRAVVGREVLANKPYRLSAWVNGGDLPANAGRLYASINGTVLGETSIAAATTKKAGNWYRLTLTVNFPEAYAGQVAEFGCRNMLPTPNTALVYFDDFRVCPVTATMRSDVYDPRTNQRTYSLDNENLYTRYEYNPVGRLLRVFRETFDRPNDGALTPKLIKEYDQNYSQSNAPVWIADAYRCVTDVNGNTNGLEERHVVDSNPLNVPPMPAKWEANGYSLNCAPIVCSSSYVDNHVVQLRRLRNNQCEAASSDGPECVANYSNGRTTYVISTILTYLNGDVVKTSYTSANGCGSVQLKSLKKVSRTDQKRALHQIKEIHPREN